MDDRLRIFSLWTDDANKDLRENVYDKKYLDLDFGYIERIQKTTFICGKCSKSRKVNYHMFTTVCNPLRYMREGETIICGQCIGEKNEDLRRILMIVKEKGIPKSCAYVHMNTGLYYMVCGNSLVYNYQRDYFISAKDGIEVSKNRTDFIPSDLELRMLYPEVCDPYYHADSTLFDILLHIVFP